MKNRTKTLVVTICLAMPCGAAGASRIPAPPFHEPLIIGSSLISVADPEGDVVCVDLRNRQVAWRRRLGKGYYGLYHTQDGLIAYSGNEFTVLSQKKGSVVCKEKLPGMLMGVGKKGSVFVVRGSDNSLIGFAPEEKRTIWTVPKVRVDPVAVSTHFLFCISEHEVTVRMEKASAQTEITEGEYTLLCIDVKTGMPIWKEPLDYVLNGNVGHDIPLKEAAGLLLCTIGNSIWLVNSQDGSLIATHSFPTDHNTEWGSSSVRDALFWDNSHAVVIVGQPRFPPDISANSYKAYVLNLPEFAIKTHMMVPPLLYDSIVIADVLYSGSASIHLLESRIISRGQDHRNKVQDIGGWAVPSVDGWLYLAGCRNNSVKYGTSRVLARMKLGTHRFEELVEEPSSYKKENTEQVESTVPVKAALGASSTVR